MPQARAVMSEHIKAGDLAAMDALFCTTGAAAIGAMRAMADHGLVPGRDIAVCAADGEGHIGKHLSPSLTFPQGPAEDPYWEMCLDWFGSENPEWPWPMIMLPTGYHLFVGESTDPDYKSEPSLAG
jgi:hypothetical protein